MEFEFTTEIEEADVTIRFDYQPEESTVLYYSDGSGYPGCAASVDNIEVYWHTQKFNSTILKHDDVKIDVTDFLRELGHDIEELCFNHLETLAQ